MRRTAMKRWFAAPLLVAAVALAGACASDDTGPGGAGGSGGSGGSGGAPPGPVVCDELAGSIPVDGDACTTPGELCDIPGGTCSYQCGNDLIWRELCWACPDERPAHGDACDPGVNSGDCTYSPEVSCGPGSGTTFTCDALTSSWKEDFLPCS